jgi:hypothetical protein
MSTPHAPITDPKEVDKFESRLAKDAKSEEKDLKHFAKDVKKAEKLENKANKVSDPL